MSLEMVDDGTGNLVPTVRLTGANFLVVNGLGSTNGSPAAPDSIDPAVTVTNGSGNLIVGYNETGNPNGDDRTGSHNIVFGHGNSFASFGRLVGPRDNTASGGFSTVSGGMLNQSSGALASIGAGPSNRCALALADDQMNGLVR